MSNFLDRREKYFDGNSNKKVKDNINDIYKITSKDILAFIIASLKIVMPVAFVLLVLYLIILKIIDFFIL